MQAEGEMDSDFVADILSKAHQFIITEEQAEAVANTVTRTQERRTERAAQEQRKVAVVDGQAVEVTGKVVTTKWQDSQYGSTLKMMVLVTTEDDGEYRLWGSVPSKIDVANEDTVTFTAQVEASRDDPSFGFFSRPRKASVIAQ